MASFSQLPVELVEHIFGYLKQSSLSSVSQLNKNSRTLAIPLLYRNVDLSLPPGEKVPRIDRFCLNLLQNARLAAHVESLTIGPQPGGEGYQGQRWLRSDKHFNDDLMMELATKVLEQETLSQEPDFFKDAIAMREYAAFAALVLFVLPTLQRLHLSEFKCAIMDRVFSVFRNLEDGPSWVRRRPSEAFLRRLSNITSVSMNVDKTHGISYLKDTRRLDLGDIFYLPGLQEVELSLPVYSMAGPAPMHFPTWRARNRLLRNVVPTSITRVVIRTSANSLHVFEHFFESTPKLRSFTYEFCYDLDEVAAISTINLQAWTDALPKTLEELILSVECFQTSVYPFRQPRIGDGLVAYLDLTNFTRLHTLELPLPFLTGDPNFSMSTDIYPLLPPNLIHLCLRTDLTHAHHSFPFDSSNLSTGFSFQESGDEARLQLNARMDLSYMFHAALAILGFATKLKTYTIWQPADASLSWFDGQIDEFAQACNMKSVVGHILYPMLLRHKKPEQWDLVKDVMVSHPDRSPAGLVDELYRGERFGVSLGLACQYHLHALRKRQVRRR